jgi:PQQ-like domain
MRLTPFGKAVVTLLLAALAAGVWRSGVIGSVVGGSVDGTTGHGSDASSSPSPTPTWPGEGRTLPATPGPINTRFPGLTTFRGNATRDWYGQGPVPSHPAIRWRYPAFGGLCAVSSDNGITFRGPTRTWCGTGWTGQPNVIQHRNGSIEVREGAYDDHYHFLNGITGKPYRPDLVTGDLAKGSASTDNQGYPLYYAGSRDNFLRVVALDRPKPTVLWKLDAMTSVSKPTWNNDWDGAPLQIGDYLLEGGENSWFYVIKLNRRYDPAGTVEVAPRIVMEVPGYDAALFAAVKDTDVSIEDSVAFDAQTGVVYFSNGGGLVQGWDISDILRGGTKYRQVFRFWDGDDTDATIVIDPQGFLYVARHIEENVPRPSSKARDEQIGNLMKLDPRNVANPVVWSVPLGTLARDGGILGTPAYDKGIVYSTFDSGGVAAVDATSGRVLWTVTLPGPTWTSPVTVDDQLLVGDCSGVLHDFDISNPSSLPRQRWTLQLNGCVESTPAVWHGWIYVGARGGAIYGIANP